MDHLRDDHCDRLEALRLAQAPFHRSAPHRVDGQLGPQPWHTSFGRGGLDATSFEDLLIEGPWVIRWATWELRCWRIALRPSHVNAAPTSLQRHSRDGATSLARSVSDGAGPSSVTPHDRVNLRGEAGVTITKDRVNPQGARAARLDLQTTPRPP